MVVDRETYIRLLSEESGLSTKVVRSFLDSQSLVQKKLIFSGVGFILDLVCEFSLIKKRDSTTGLEYNSISHTIHKNMITQVKKRTLGNPFPYIKREDGEEK